MVTAWRVKSLVLSFNSHPTPLSLALVFAYRLQDLLIELEWGGEHEQPSAPPYVSPGAHMLQQPK